MCSIQVRSAISPEDMPCAASSSVRCGASPADAVVNDGIGALIGAAAKPPPAIRLKVEAPGGVAWLIGFLAGLPAAAMLFVVLICADHFA